MSELSKDAAEKPSEVVATPLPPLELAASPAVDALPVVDAPAITPDPAPISLDALLGEPKPEPAAVVSAAPAAPTPPAKTATERFRETAAAQIAAARERLAQRNLPSMSAVALIAGFTGALSSAGVAKFAPPSDAQVAQTRAVTESIARISDAVASLREDIERASKANEELANKTGERIAEVEKAQAEPTAKIIQLSEAIEKLRAANVASAMNSQIVGVTPRDATGSLPSAAVKPVAKSRTTPAIVEGWTLRELDRDIALVESKRGLLEILVGDEIPGLGRVEAFRKHEGHWAVATPKGLIVPQ